MKTTAEMIEVMQAFERGEEVQFSRFHCAEWKSIRDPSWNWGHCSYRIKPKPRECYVGFDLDGNPACFARKSLPHSDPSFWVKMREVIE